MTMSRLPKPANLPLIHPYPRHSSLEVKFTHRPTVALQQFEPTRVQEVILGIFKRFDYTAIDMECLIYFTLQYFHVTPATYEVMHKVVRSHILANFAIEQSGHLRLSEVSMRRSMVCYTIDKREE